MTDNQPQTQRILITFIGGAANGRILDSNSPDARDQFEIRRILAMTRAAELGRTFHSATREGLEEGEVPQFIAGPANKYVVTENLKTETERRILVTFVATARRSGGRRGKSG